MFQYLYLLGSWVLREQFLAAVQVLDPIPTIPVKSDADFGVRQLVYDRRADGLYCGKVKLETNGEDILADVVLYDGVYLLSTSYNLYYLQHGNGGPHQFSLLKREVIYLSAGIRNSALYLTRAGTIHIGERQLEISVPQGVRVMSYMYEVGFFLLTMDNQLYLIDSDGRVQLVEKCITHFYDLDYDLILYGTSEVPDYLWGRKYKGSLGLTNPVICAGFADRRVTVLTDHCDILHLDIYLQRLTWDGSHPTVRELKLIPWTSDYHLIHQDGTTTTLQI